LSYGTFRFLQDSLHVDPPRYGGWSVDQIAGAILIVTGMVTTLDLLRLRSQVE